MMVASDDEDGEVVMDLMCIVRVCVFVKKKKKKKNV